MNCNQIMDKYLELDKGERVPLKITAHLLMCKKCRKQVHLLRLAEKMAAAPIKIPVPITDNTIETVMKTINPAYENESVKNPISILKWILGGIIMILLMLVVCVFPNSKESPVWTVSFYFLFAVAVTAYCAMFVGTNMDFFVKKIEAYKIQGEKS